MKSRRNGNLRITWYETLHHQNSIFLLCLALFFSGENTSKKSCVQDIVPRPFYPFSSRSKINVIPWWKTSMWISIKRYYLQYFNRGSNTTDPHGATKAFNFSFFLDSLGYASDWVVDSLIMGYPGWSFMLNIKHGSFERPNIHRFYSTSSGSDSKHRNRRIVWDSWHTSLSNPTAINNVETALLFVLSQDGR